MHPVPLRLTSSGVTNSEGSLKKNHSAHVKNTAFSSKKMRGHRHEQGTGSLLAGFRDSAEPLAGGVDGKSPSADRLVVWLGLSFYFL